MGQFNEKGTMSQRLPGGWHGEQWRPTPGTRAGHLCAGDFETAMDP